MTRILIVTVLLSMPTYAQRVDGNGNESRRIATCLPALQDAATGGCLSASSVPTQGMLYPLGPDFYFEASGRLRLTESLFTLRHLTAGGSVDAGGDIFAGNALHGRELFLSGSAFRTQGLGIGTGAPDADLHIRRNGPVELLLEANSNVTLHTARLHFSKFQGIDQAFVGYEDSSGSFSIRNLYSGGGTRFDHHTSSLDSWSFRRRASTAIDVEARITYNGNLQLDGTVSTGGADLAEYYPLAERVEPGDVVAFSGDGLTLEPAHAGSSHRLAGVISSRPGVVLGLSYTRADETGIAPPSLRASLDETSRGVQAERRPAVDELVEAPVDPDVLHEIEVNRRAPLALSGRIPCKVTAENGPVRPGDLLTPSSVPGRAMRASGGGPVIGTALEGLGRYEGTILVFVNLGWFSADEDLERRVAELEERLARLEGRER